MRLTSFHDYRLLKELAQQVPGSVEIIKGEVIFNEGLWDKAKGIGNKVGNYFNRTWPNSTAKSNLGNPSSNSVQDTGAPAAGLQKPVMAQSLGYPSQSADTGVQKASTGNPFAQSQNVGRDTSKERGVSTLTHPDFKTDVQSIKSVFQSLKTPQLRSLMQQWMGKIFQKIPGSQETAAGVGPEGSGTQGNTYPGQAPGDNTADTGANAMPSPGRTSPQDMSSTQYTAGTAGNPFQSASTFGDESPQTKPMPTPLRRAAMSRY